MPPPRPESRAIRPLTPSAPTTIAAGLGSPPRGAWLNVRPLTSDRDAVTKTVLAAAACSTRKGRAAAAGSSTSARRCARSASGTEPHLERADDVLDDRRHVDGQLLHGTAGETAAAGLVARGSARGRRGGRGRRARRRIAVADPAARPRRRPRRTAPRGEATRRCLAGCPSGQRERL